MIEIKKAGWQAGGKYKSQLRRYTGRLRLSSKNFEFSFCPRKIPNRPANRVTKSGVMEIAGKGVSRC